MDDASRFYASQAASESGGQLSPRAQRVVRFAMWVPAVVLGFLAFLFAYVAWLWMAGDEAPTRLATSLIFVQENQTELLLQPEQRSTVASLLMVWFLSLGSVFAALALSFLLLKGYRDGHIFTLRQADRLRRIGWMIVLAAPLMIFGKSINYSLLHNAIGSGSDRFSIGIEHVDLLMLAFGMLIVVVGHVMRSALAIAEENESFV